MNFSKEREGLIENGIYVCLLEDVNWNLSNVVLAIWRDGRFYDTFVIEDTTLSDEEWDITDFVIMHSFTGKTYDKN